jgi:hypothetical protein
MYLESRLVCFSRLDFDLDDYNSIAMDVLKIGVLTFHRCINYGSYWQARCLVEGLKTRGHDAVILDHESRQINLKEWKCAYQPVLPTQVPTSDYPLYRKKIMKFFNVIEGLPLSKRFRIDMSHETEDYDVVIVGSDEVWNLIHPWYGGCPLFYGDGLRAKRLVSYAVSFGNYAAAWGLSEEWISRLRNFEAISVRDENSQTLIKNALGVEPEMILDPCLQFPFNIESKDSDFTTPYLAVYGHNFSTEFINQIKRFAQQRSLSLISVGYRNDWADEQWISADPLDFANFIHHADAVATNFFHGCVFSLANEKPFVCETMPYRVNKIQGLMNKIGGEHHLVNESTPGIVYDERLSEPIHHSIIDRLAELRVKSNRFLDNALAVTKSQVA